MKALFLLAALAAGSVPASANMPAELASDPLMKQILAKQLTLDNGGIKSFVAVKGTGGIELLQPAAAPAGMTEEAAALAGLRVAEGLTEKPSKKKAKKPVRRADDQLAAIEAEGAKASWDKTRK